ncbi:MAG: ABC transporter ATP-binding protein [Desulfomonilia bacterium]|jgi:putative ABC transport system ATP-binding protein
MDTAQANGALIRLEGITKVYGSGTAAVHALKGIDLTIGNGEFVAVMGPSGSGKSTCMNILGCLDTPTSGTYWFKGVDVGALSRDKRAILRRNYLGFVFQGFNLLNRTSALENVELPLIYRGVPARRRREKACEALRAVGLDGWEYHTPAELSGGQQQRVAIARAMVIEPEVLMADEPTGNLDSTRSREIMDLLCTFNRERGVTIVMVTHDAGMAGYARRVIHFLDGLIDSEEHNGGCAP